MKRFFIKIKLSDGYQANIRVTAKDADNDTLPVKAAKAEYNNNKKFHFFHWKENVFAPSWIKNDFDNRIFLIINFGKTKTPCNTLARRFCFHADMRCGYAKRGCPFLACQYSDNSNSVYVA